MTEAQEFVDRSESSIFDRKAAEYDVKKVANTLIAFANADGGSVVLGIKDRKLEGVDHLSNKRKNDLIQAGFDLVIPKLKVEHKYVKYINTDGSEGNLLVLSVAPSSDIIYTNTKDEVYLRVGDETKKLGYEDRRQLEFDRGIRNYESTVIKDALLDDLDADMVEEYKKLYDFEGDDIWNKFFLQPGEYELDEVNQSQYLALSPNMNVMNTMRYIMDEVSRGTDLTWPKGRWNQRVKHYIDERKKKFLPYPERTLGILLRGTDYIHNPLPNHPKHAAAETVMEKIDEVREAWDVDWLYLATEDEQICLKMKERYGESLCFTDQERYQVKPGQLLVDLHQEKKEGEGFRLGAEYLCSVYLLARCSSLIASGSCGALSEALRENNGKYKHVFVFEG